MTEGSPYQEVSAGEDGSVITIAELVARAERRVRDGDAAEVLDELWWVAQGAYDVGLGWLAMKLLEEIDRIIPVDAIDSRWQGWICNLRGLVLSKGASSSAARAEYERMRPTCQGAGRRRPREHRAAEPGRAGLVRRRSHGRSCEVHQ